MTRPNGSENSAFGR